MLYEKRSQNYRNLFDPKVGLMRGRNQSGTLQMPFNPFKWGDAFTEGKSWHYTWSVFHDVLGATRDFDMVSAPNTARGTAAADAPFSVSKSKR